MQISGFAKDFATFCAELEARANFAHVKEKQNYKDSYRFQDWSLGIRTQTGSSPIMDARVRGKTHSSFFILRFNFRKFAIF